MPAVRSKGKRNGEDSFQLTWATPPPTDPVEPQTFSFAPNVTPVTFTAPPPADEDDIPSQSSLFPDPVPSASNPASPASTGPYQPAAKRRRRNNTAATSTGAANANGDGDDGQPAHIPRPPNAFILFRSSFIKSQHVSSAIEGNHGTLSKIVGMLWHNLAYEERQIWQAKARRAYAEHKRMYPEYSFRPAPKDKAATASASVSASSSSTTNASTSGDDTSSGKSRDGSAPPPPAKRRQRECGPRDVVRCEHIASLLARGLKGHALEDAMREFDATRAPAVITPRFEAPITAQAFQARGGPSPSASLSPVKVKSEDGNGDVRGEDGAPAQRVKQEERPAPAQPSFRRFRRSSSVPLLDAEHSETARRQASFMQPSASFAPASPAHASSMHPQHNPSQSQSQQHHAPVLASPLSIRAARKRSASSSPPIRPRPLMPHLSLPTMSASASSTYAHTHTLSHQHSHPEFQQHQQPQPQLSLMTGMGGAYAASAPLSAPVLSHAHAHSMSLARQQQPLVLAQPTPVQGHAPGDSVFFDLDGSQGAAWYTDLSSASVSASSGPSSAGNPGSEFSYGAVEVGQGQVQWEAQQDFNFDPFAFSTAQSPTPASVSASASAHESYSPFEQTSSAAPSTSTSTSAVEDYSGMPMLVDPPAHHPLAIQTQWNATEFEYDPAYDSAYAPPSSAGGLGAPHATAFDYAGGAYASPTSPSSDGAPTQAHTPREGSCELGELAVRVYSPEAYPAAPASSSAQSHPHPHCQAQPQTYTAQEHEQALTEYGAYGVNVSINVPGMKGVDVDVGAMQAFFAQQAKLGNITLNPLSLGLSMYEGYGEAMQQHAQ